MPKLAFYLEKFHVLWNQMLSTNEGQKIRKILSLDGKTQCGTGNSTQKAKWAGLKSIVMTQNTFAKGDLKTVETRYFISSLEEDVNTVARAVRGHWMVESYHWHLDVTFREDANRTLEKQAAYNLNIIRKLAINSLKLFEIAGMKLSLKKKRFAICQNVEKHLEMLLNI